MQANLEKKERNMGVELLRIVSMLMVVVLHILGQGGVLAGVSAAPGSARYAVVYLLESCAYVATNCYALISGYVGGHGHFRYVRLFETQARVMFYTVLITIGFCIAMPELFGFSTIINALFPAMRGQYWYYTAYFGLMILMPALQCMIAHLTKVQFRSLVVSMVWLFSILPTLFVSDIFQTGNGYSLLWLIVLYLIGAYLKKYGCSFLQKTWSALAVYVLCVLVTWGIQIAQARGVGMLLPRMLRYTSPAMLLASVSLLTAFAGLRIPRIFKKTVAFCAPLSFSVYLIHVHPFVWNYVMEGRFASFANTPAYVLVTVVLGAAVAIYVVCTLIDVVRAWLFRLCRVHAVCEWLEERLRRMRKENGVQDVKNLP